MTPYDLSYAFLRMGEAARRAADALRDLGLLLIEEDADD